MTEKTKKWNDEAVAKLLEVVGDESPVSVIAVEKAAEVLEVSARSVAAKLRQLDREVASMAHVAVPTFTEDEGAQLAAFVKANEGIYTYKEIAEQFADGKFSAKQIQGKILALELTGAIKPAEKLESVKTYTDAEEAIFIKMANDGAFLEDIAAATGKTLASVRGKSLSLMRSKDIEKIPGQKSSHAKNNIDPVDALGATLATMTVEELAKKLDKTTRGVRTLLTRRGLDTKDYLGSKKKEKAEGRKAAA